MDTLQKQDALRRLRIPSPGVYPADRIPRRWSRPMNIIANTEDHTQAGAHWIAMHVDQYGRGVFFDSYGMPPVIPHHRQRIRKNSLFYTYNNKQLQCLNSKVCGQYCIMFLDYMNRGYTLEKFCKLFSSDCNKNDNIVSKYYNRIKGISQGQWFESRLYIGHGMRKKCNQSCRSKHYSINDL